MDAEGIAYFRLVDSRFVREHLDNADVTVA